MISSSFYTLLVVFLLVALSVGAASSSSESGGGIATKSQILLNQFRDLLINRECTAAQKLCTESNDIPSVDLTSEIGTVDNVLFEYGRGGRPECISLLECMLEKEIILPERLDEDGFLLMNNAASMHANHVIVSGIKKGCSISGRNELGGSLLHTVLNYRESILLAIQSMIRLHPDRKSLNQYLFALQSTISILENQLTDASALEFVQYHLKELFRPYHTNLLDESIEDELRVTNVAKFKHVHAMVMGQSIVSLKAILAGAKSRGTDVLTQLITRRDKYSRTPIHVAAITNNVYAANLILSHYTDIILSQRLSVGQNMGEKLNNIINSYLNVRDSLKRTAFDLACSFGHFEFAMFLYNYPSKEAPWSEVREACLNVTLVPNDLIQLASGPVLPADNGGWKDTKTNKFTQQVLKLIHDRFDVPEDAEASVNAAAESSSEDEPASKSRCDAIVVDATKLSNQEIAAIFLEHGYKKLRPMVFRGLAKKSGLRQRFRKDVLLASSAAKKLMFNISSIPYGDHFGIPTKSISLYNYIRDIYSEKNSSALKSQYIFSMPKLQSSAKTQVKRKIVTDQAAYRELFGDITTFFPFLNLVNITVPQKFNQNEVEPLMSDSELNQIGQVIQFYLGNTGTGAPMHFHNDAVNLLAYGEKQWFFLPPYEALFSSKYIGSFLLDYYNQRATNQTFVEQNQIEMLTCRQYAGDVMYVPQWWSHGVFNLKPSVGIAIEFNPKLSTY
jgi:JmjC domain, hydroxylase